jgi:tRNA(Ile)-lysidine synthetase-like protein
MIWMLLVLARRTSGWHRARALRRLTPRCASFAPLPEDTTKDVLDYWFTEEARQRWFASTAAFDHQVSDRYASTLSAISDVEVEDVATWAATAPLDDVLAHVLLWDQIARHLARVSDADPASLSAVAMAASRASLSRADDLKAERQAFLLMPLRHSFDRDILEAEVLPLSRKWAQNAQDSERGVWRRFDAALCRALLKLKTRDGQPQPSETPVSWAPFSQLLASSPQFREDAFDVKPDEVGALAAHKAVKQFLLQRLDDSNATKVVCSLSGGVDSIVLTYVVARLLRTTPALNHLALETVHVDYGNRATSGDEANFVKAYAAWLGVPLWLRSIDILQKSGDNVERAAYESVTRDARFWTYAEACGSDGVVLLGHNRDDTFENLFANINRRQHYDQLRGMTAVSEERGVRTWRPLLAIDKSSIYAAAATLKLPHLADSTDPACQRGVFRDSWLPVVRESQPLLLPGLESLADHVSFLTDIWREKCSAYVSTCERFAGGASLPVETWMTEAPSSFWVDVLRRLEAPHRPSNKALENLQSWLRRQRAARRASTCELGAVMRAEYVPSEDVLRVYFLDESSEPPS